MKKHLASKATASAILNDLKLSKNDKKILKRVMKPKIKLEVNLPQELVLWNDDEENVVMEILKRISNKIRIKCIVRYDSEYTYIVYTGKLTDPANKKLVDEIKKFYEGE